MRLFVLGAGGHGRVVADAAEDARVWSEVRFLDDRYPRLDAVDGWPVDGRLSDAVSVLRADDAAVVAIGDPVVRMATLQALIDRNQPLGTVVHPSATRSRRAVLGGGTVLLAGGRVNVGAKLGLGVIVNTGATVDHDCTLGDGVHVAPGAHLGGDVTVGRLSWVGIGATVRHGITLGDQVMIGAGAAVVSDIPSGSLAVGVPARIVARK